MKGIVELTRMLVESQWSQLKNFMIAWGKLFLKAVNEIGWNRDLSNPAQTPVELEVGLMI